ncbi:MAG: hypothetical protein HY903_23815 [Deltaproteobacteria bacterium]|nr:hypothetical protein [Deltaproteobacteria bacterium]
MRRTSLAIAVSALLGAAAGCQGEAEDALSGSIAAIGYSLDFSTIRITRSETELIVRYEKEEVLPDGAIVVQQQPTRIVVPLGVETVEADTPLTLPGAATFEHNVIRLDPSGNKTDEPQFPPVDSGQLEFTDLGGQVGDRVAGNFDLVFNGGYTLLGKFHADLTLP